MESLARGALAVIFATALTHTPLSGTWALPSGKPAATAEMRVSGDDRNVGIDIVQTSDKTNTPIRQYDSDMTKLMHLIVISQDFRQFQHVHPHFDAADGHFTDSLALDPHQRYYVYADTDPAGLGQQVFRFTLQNGTPAMGRIAIVRPLPSSPIVSAGPYTVALSTTTLKANTPQDVNVDITRDAKPAADLKPYLGAAAHAVFINTASLDYVHVHPSVPGASDDDDMSASMAGMDMGPAKTGPKMVMHLPALPAGNYKLWLQFQGSALEVAPFTLAVR